MEAENVKFLLGGTAKNELTASGTKGNKMMFLCQSGTLEQHLLHHEIEMFL